jgi:ferrous iron transport protein B
MIRMYKVALFGNPNTGKSSLFNVLTGLRQKIGNFPGVTVDIKQGDFHIGKEKFKLYDFPGTYSLFPKSNEERLVFDVLSNSNHESFPDMALLVMDIANLERNLLLLDQIVDLGIPTVCALNMADVANKQGLTLNVEELHSKYPQCKFVEINARVGLGKERLLNAIEGTRRSERGENNFVFEELADLQVADLDRRRQKIKTFIDSVLTRKDEGHHDRSLIDRLLVHPVWGYVIFIAILLVIFQSIFALAAYPMDWIDQGMAMLSQSCANFFPAGALSDLFIDGLLAGVGGVLVFIPQIALLFLFLGILEETGYLARVIFLMDRLVRPFGLNGRSVVPLMSSWACAIPGIMAARTIGNWKERMITIFIAPLMSCSARIPVYTLLIALVIPDETVWGIFNYQGLTLLGLYLLGLVSALLLALAMKVVIKKKERSFLVLEMPKYKPPHWPNVWTTVYTKTKGFVWDAGKIILAFSIILWAAASYSTDGKVDSLKIKTVKGIALSGSELASAQLEESFLGSFGRGIQPVLTPLGYDWKIGVALLSSFAAREIFVGSLATIYAVENGEEDQVTLLQTMKNQKDQNGKPIFTLASGLSLMVFYVYALQCMATVAVVRKETKSWSWPIGQFVIMGLMAYFMAYIVFQTLS